MAKNMQPYLKRCRTLGISPAVMGVNKESNRNPCWSVGWTTWCSAWAWPPPGGRPASW